MSAAESSGIDVKLRELALKALQGPFPDAVPSNPALLRLRALGTVLWLDTGVLEEASELWHAELSALTTNNTLANQVVQTGAMDDAARDAVRELRSSRPGIGEDELLMELGFVVNCRIALRLVRALNARVSVELHPSVADDVERTVAWARRYHAVCPERFTIKIPLTPAGYCAVARVRKLGIPVNYTLGFSARQNYVAAVVSNPSYCNVFLGRLNSVVVDNGMGDGRYVGEKATVATQVALRELRKAGRTETRLIAASMRAASQVTDLAGTDVYTIPPKVVRDFLSVSIDPDTISDQVSRVFKVDLKPGVDPNLLGPLWVISPDLRSLADDLAARGGETLTPADVSAADRDHRTHLFYSFSPEDVAEIREHGKIPDLRRWIDRDIAIDDLMTQCALQSFAVDQAALDDRLCRLANA